MGKLNKHHIFRDLIFSNFATGKKLMPFCNTEDMPSLENIVYGLLDNVADLHHRTFYDYQLGHFRESPNVQMFLTTESQLELPAWNRKNSKVRYVTKTIRGTTRLAIQTAAIDIYTGSSNHPGTCIHDKVPDQHIVRDIDGKDVCLNLIGAFHNNCQVLINAAMSSATPEANENDFGHPNFESFTQAMVKQEDQRGLWYPTLSTLF